MAYYTQTLDLSNLATTNEQASGWFEGGPEPVRYIPTPSDLRENNQQQLIIDVMCADKATQAEIKVMLDRIFGRVAA